MDNQKPQPTAKKQPKTTLADLKALGFSDDVEAPPRRLIASVSGKEGTGKSHMVFTAPTPIFLFNIDIGTEGVVEKFQTAGHDIYVYDVRVPKGAKQEVYQAMWSDVKDRVAKVYQYNEGTLAADTATEMYELARLAHFGKLTQVMPHHYTEVNAQWREFLRSAFDSKMNTILVNKVKAVYINDKRTKDYEISGFSETPYMVQVAITTVREQTDEGIRFGFSIDKCRKKPSLIGQEYRTVIPIVDSEDLVVDPVFNFNYLLELVHGEE